MSDSDLLTTTAAPSPPAWNVCDQCHAPLEHSQRYCVVCGSRRLGADDPAARFLADATRRTRSAPDAAQAPAGAAPARRSTLLIALLIALIPVAAALGVTAGRNQRDDAALVKALRSQGQPVINITGAAGAADTATSSGKKKASSESASSGGKKLSDGSKVLATGPAGSARQLEGSKVSAKQLQESKQAVKRINESKGKAYVESQRNLPDQIVIP